MSLRQLPGQILSDVITTTDATVTVSTNCSYVVPSGAYGYIIYFCIAKKTSNGTVMSSTISQSFRNVSGTLTLAGTAVNIVSPTGDATLLTATLSFSVSGTTLQPQVTGIAATTLEWTLDATYFLA